MDKNQLEGIGHQVKGALKQGLGRLLGDAKLTADGAAERVGGQAQSARGEPMIGIDADRIKGVGHQISGAFKEGLGKLTGDQTRVAAGIAERADGKIQNEAGSARDEAREAEQDSNDPTKH
jgi:uncharacterized protein YjbJ (UPF0337 family)